MADVTITAESSGTLTVPAVDDNYSLVVISYGSVRQYNTPPTIGPFSCSWNSHALTEVVRRERSFSYLHPCCGETTYGKVQAAIHRIDNPDSGTMSITYINLLGGSIWCGLIKNAHSGGQIIDAASAANHYDFAPPNPIKNGSVLVSIARPYRLPSGSDTFHMSWYYTVSPSDMFGERIAAVSKAVPGYTASWSATANFMALGLWLEPMDDIPLFAFFGGQG